MQRRSSLVMVLAFFLASLAGAQEKDQFGSVHSWKGPVGQYTLIDFAATWCGPCWTSLPKLVTLAELSPGLRVLVVSVDQKVEGRDYLVERLGLQLPVLWDGEFAIAEHYKPEGMPATYVLDPEGKVVYSHTGSSDSDWNELVRLVSQLDLKSAG